MLILKNKWFSRFAGQEDISDANLCKAIQRAERGLIDANLGGGVIKQRIARPNQGRSSGFRSIVVFQSGERSIFVYGFAKSDRDNISDDELKAFKDLAQELLSYTVEQMQTAMEAGALIEVKCDEENV